MKADIYEKNGNLCSNSAKYDVSCLVLVELKQTSKRRIGSNTHSGIYTLLSMEDVSLLKILL